MADKSKVAMFEEDTEESSVDSSSKDEGRERDIWSRKIEYILSLIGYSVGLGNLWRFPYLCIRNGGGAFLIPFFFFLFLCGVPLYFMEICLGQYSGKSALVVWSSISPLFRGLGFLMIIISGVVSWYYNLVITWVIYYLVHAFFPHIPWATCDNDWNTDKCIVSRADRLLLTNTTTHVNVTDMINGTEKVNSYNSTAASNGTADILSYNTAALEFWQYNVLKKSSGIEELGEVQWHLVLCLFGAWLLTFLCLIKGIYSVGKVVYVTVLLPYLLLTIFLIRGLTLDGSTEGIMFYLRADFSRLLHFQVWLEAAVQVFFSLGPAWGSLITMSSYSKFRSNCLKDAMYGTLADGLSSFYAGFVVFSILGFMAHDAGLTMEEVAEAGPGLVFVAYPEAIMKLPLPHLWGVLFFLMLITVGIDSQFGMFETVSSGLVDSFPSVLKERKVQLTAALSVILFILGLPFTTQGGIYIFQLIDWYASALCIVLGSFLECIVISWIYGAERFSRDIMMMLGRPVPMILRVCWCIITPTILLTVFLGILTQYGPPNTAQYTYPDYAAAIGNIFAFIPLLPIPIFAVAHLWKKKGSFVQRMKRASEPDSDWGPIEGRNFHKDYQYGDNVPKNMLINLVGDRNV
ncbi:sodium- and chloride-dependent glycine transporter 1-like [Mizuhopecten yessoensis]|uniref:Transporter n=1 Tax=Mizuhopecten yessoensis TaxID=6573 RepID=A0A210QXX0_MIZYE|nr:sodium- and chloride-dependent glycine transporter 1-like [Mizuhopecten yessoensis]XP_021347084.1 sodium- and chloride-dependent glycine transporter 1-like [Mizuhopecten yessoensis]OWF53555.1 Sodium- and chloride-dependent glycine transporter 1 [Mizuhopecten yessoensis]